MLILSDSDLSPGAAAKGIGITSEPLPVEHVKITTKRSYSEVKAGIERLGRLDDSIRALLAKNEIEGLRAALKRIAGEDGLAIHYIGTHGDFLALKGERRPVTAYLIGNVLSAVEMTKVNLAAGLYAPLRVIAYANDEGGTTMEYDRPTSMFGQFKEPEIDAMAQSVDKRLLTFLLKVGGAQTLPL
ncbi:MAG: DUF302 domain-containing protein [Bradyrhizobium sp.]